MQIVVYRLQNYKQSANGFVTILPFYGKLCTFYGKNVVVVAKKLLTLRQSIVRSAHKVVNNNI